jgi:hypothetical protein
VRCPTRASQHVESQQFLPTLQAARSAQNGQGFAKFKPGGVKLLVNSASTVIAGMVRVRTERI